MPALRPTEFYGTITWLGLVDESTRNIRARSVARVEAGFAGIVGEAHSGLTRGACVRVRDLYEKGTEIRNVRQLSVLSTEELAQIAAQIGLEALDPAYLGATMVLEGIPDFSHVPPNARLQAPSGATLTVDMVNLPCKLPAKEIEFDMPGHGGAFKKAAKGRRGVTAWVEREGHFALGDKLRLFVPNQPVWAHL
ncbi:MAG: MOSC domain-containing protein [Sulfitobacter sp.]